MFAQSDLTHLPTNNQQVPALDGQDYSPADSRKIQFLLPSQLGFVNFSSSYLSFDFELINQKTAAGVATCASLRPSEAYGMLGMFRMARIYAGNGELLSETDDVNVISSSLYSYQMEVGDGLANKLSLTEQYLGDDETLNPLFVPPMLPAADDGGTAAIDTVCTPLKQRVNIKVPDAVLMHDKLFSVAGCGGVRIELTLRDAADFLQVNGMEIDNDVVMLNAFGASQALSATSIEVLSDEKLNANWSFDVGAATFSIDDGIYSQDEYAAAWNTAAGQLAQPYSDLTMSFPQPDTMRINNNNATDVVAEGGPSGFLPWITDSSNDVTLAGSADTDIAISTARLGMEYIPLAQPSATVCNPEKLLSCPFVVGSHLKVQTHATENIVSIRKKAAEGLYAEDCILLRLDTPLQADVDGTAAMPVVTDVAAAEFALTKLNYVVQAVQVPPTYLSDFVKKLNSDSGVETDIAGWSLTRNNMYSGETKSSLSLPFNLSRIQSIMSIPYKTATSSFFARDFVGTYNNYTNYVYQYEVFGSLQNNPSRGVDLRKYASDGIGAHHVVEFQKGWEQTWKRNMRSLVGMGIGWLNEKKCFAFSRRLGDYGGSFDARGKNISLLIETAGGQDTNKMCNSYARCVRRLIMKSDGVAVLS